MEPSAIRMDQRVNSGNDGRRYAEPQGAHVDSDSYVPSYGAVEENTEEESETADFSESLVDKIASLQAKKKNEKYQTRNYKRAERMVQQRRRDAQENGAWHSRDPDDSRHAAYHRRAKQQMQRMLHPTTPSNTTSGSGSSGMIARKDYFRIHE